MGASKRVAHGSVQLKSGVNIEQIQPRSVTLSDSTQLPAPTPAPAAARYSRHSARPYGDVAGAN
jgi:hypothetical protein